MNLERVHEDVAAGRLWKALDRLQGMRAHAPADQAVLELIGRLRADMGDLPGAGLAWFLTDGDDPRRDAAFAAMRERHGRVALHLVHKLKVRAPVDAFPPGARARLTELRDELDAIGVRWRPGEHRSEVVWREASKTQTAAGVAGCLALFALFLVPWIRGIQAFLD